ncbi:hypothetical protein [Tsukamurella spumae]|uniref:Uncharacterized protein n=1 Tax=Tsukamurella spumae TaxID=44753 RepID=A0A846WXS7_9ACTN|nr:hypothetical protein [Tsukamurella spumae]NKY16909.1 hypothetical protein [Tsukamurella spumae]
MGPRGPIAVGDEVVVYRGDGVYASAAIQQARAVLPKPAGLGWEDAAGLLLTGATAWDAVERIGLAAGDTVLIHGAAGGVGRIGSGSSRSRGSAAPPRTASSRSVAPTPRARASGMRPAARCWTLRERGPW